MIKKNKVGIIGLGYVGLPLAIEFSRKNKVIGFDLNKKRISELTKGKDTNNEVLNTKIKNLKNIEFSYNDNKLKNCDIFIVTVPTPVDNKNLPDLRLIKKACEIVAKYIKKGSIFILESTVYPGCTEKFCVPILEKVSKLKFNKDFYCGYSPERINPGDNEHNFKNIVKVTSGSNYKISKKINNLYKSVFKNTHKADSIMVAEAAKVIENIQRDLNIALVNELSIILDKLGVNTRKVIEAAGTKWNFQKFYPGLVGGHCISVDPYYLTYVAKLNNYNPKVILAGRKVNNFMKFEVVRKFTNEIKKRGMNKTKAKVLVMGITFKENVSDLRNSQALEVVNILLNKKFNLDIYDPLIDQAKIRFKNKTISIKKMLPKKRSYDAILILTPHDKIKSISIKNILKICKKKFILFDIKNYLNLQIKEYIKL
jgi:UDP-N-acetyl-D-glucosamine/UDP-N-acetyl-D-galactosamine dehydrogenase